MKNLTKKQLHQFIAVFCVFLFCGAGNYDAQLQAKIIAQFPDVATSTIRLAWTYPMFISGALMMVTGAFVGRKISYRATCIIGSIIMGISGIIPVFYCPSFTFFLITRSIIGIGLGLYGGRTAYLALTTPKEEYAKLFGYCNAAMKGSAIIMPIIVGYLAKISWNLGFIIYVVPLLTAIVMFIWMEEPEYTQTAEGGQKEKKKLHVPSQLWLVVIVMMVFMFGNRYTSWSEYVVNNNLGDTVLAGYMQSIQNYAGLMAVLFFGPISKKLGKNALPLCFITLAVDFALMLLVKSVVVAIIGPFIWGVAYTLYFTSMQVISTNIADENTKALCSSIVLGVPLFAMLLTNGAAEVYFKILGIGTITDSAMIVCAGLYILAAVLSIVFKLNKYSVSENK